MSKHTIPLLIALTVVISFAMTAQSKTPDRNELWKGRFRIENPGPGYKANLDSSSIAAGGNLFDLISVLPGVTFEGESFKVNCSKVAGIYINDVKIHDMYSLKFIGTAGVSNIKVTYAPDGDSSAGSDGGKIKIYYRTTPQTTSGILSGGVSFAPEEGFARSALFSDTDVRKGKLSISNSLHYSGNDPVDRKFKTQSTPTGEEVTSSTTSGPKHKINEKLLLQYDLTPQNSLSASITFAGEYSNPMTLTEAPLSMSKTFNKSLRSECGTEVIYNLSLPGKVDLSASLSYTHISDARFNRYISDEESGESAKVGTNQIEASITAAVPVAQKHNLIVGGELDATLSAYRLLLSYGDTSFDESVKSAGTQGYVSRVYALMSGRLGIISYSAGANLQANILSYSDNTLHRKAHTSIVSINPTLKINLPLDKQESSSMDFVYRRSTSDIPYKAITPYRYWSDELNYTIGNPSLKAPSSHLVMAAFNLLSSALNIGLTYRCDNDEISFVRFTDQDDPRVTYTKPINLDQTHTFSLNIGVSYTKSKHFKSRLFLRADLLKEHSEIGSTHYGALRHRAYASLNNSISFGKGFGAELNARYQPRYRQYEKTYSACYAIYGSVFKTFLSESLRLAINFTALAQGGSYMTDTYRMTNASDQRYIGLSASWRF